LRIGCIGDWAPFLGPTGPILFDRSGYGNHGILTRMDVATDWVPSGAGHALDFDGINDLVLIGSISDASPMFSAIDRGTMCTWVKIPTTGAGASFRAIFSKEYYYGMFIVDGILSWFNWGAGGGGNKSTGISISDNLWHHVSLTFANDILQGNMYLDGKKVLTSGLGRNTVVGRLQIANNGAYSDANNQCLKGQVDGSMIFNRILSEKEIRLLASRRGIAHEVAPRRRSIVQGSAPVTVSLNSNNLMMGTYL
jgi:hypothetical protein